jgi:hypothetical protein
MTAVGEVKVKRFAFLIGLLTLLSVARPILNEKEERHPHGGLRSALRT